MATTKAQIRRDVLAFFKSAGIACPSTPILLQDGTAQTKLAKNELRTFGVSMPPARLWIDAGGNYSHTATDGAMYLGNVCPWADGCEETCIASTGHYGMGQSLARGWVRYLWKNNRELFVALLAAELRALDLRAEKEEQSYAVRLNVTSDIMWTRFVDATDYPSLTFYDYTKNVDASTDGRDVTVSVTRKWSVDDMRDAIARGVRLAVVVPTAGDAASQTFAGLPAINGDDSDARYNDPRGVVVLLRIKRPTNGAPVSAIYAGGMVRDITTGEIL
jgi:hypothetical protein